MKHVLKKQAKYIVPIKAGKKGIISKIDAYKVGNLSCYLGAGRQTKEDSINPRVGFIFNKKVGETVEAEEIVGYIYADDMQKANEVLENNIVEIA